MGELSSAPHTSVDGTIKNDIERERTQGNVESRRFVFEEFCVLAFLSNRDSEHSRLSYTSPSISAWSSEKMKIRAELTSCRSVAAAVVEPFLPRESL